MSGFRPFPSGLHSSSDVPRDPGLIDYVGGIDFLILDNVMSLTIGNAGREEIR
jgi:hypothetical protein